MLTIHPEEPEEDTTDWVKCGWCGTSIEPGIERWSADGYSVVHPGDCRKLVDSRLSGRFTDHELDEE